ncbi:MAG: L-threonylcarbamoyladenylate synthase [Myxococcota bacterium]
MRLAIHPDHPEPRKIKRAAALLQRGQVIAYPTDTTYALGCDISDRKATARLREIRRLEQDKLPTFLCSGLREVSQWARVDDYAHRIMRRFTPGPYCFILAANREVPRTLRSNRKTVGIRVSSDPVVRSLLEELGGPLVSTSARIDGESLSDPAEIDRAFPGLGMVLDVDVRPTHHSTVIDLSGDDAELLREGAGPVELA